MSVENETNASFGQVAEKNRNWRMIGWVVAVLLVFTFVIAWFDGGEMPLRPIAHSVSVPGGAI